MFAHNNKLKCYFPQQLCQLLKANIYGEKLGTSFCKEKVLILDVCLMDQVLNSITTVAVFNQYKYQ